VGQRRALIASGVEEGQAYLVAAPLSFAKFNEFVESRRHSASAAPAGDILVA
jgi:EAL domain-containing protein (putative c-di-GMP-specific phosphodiesterase class I)